MRIVWERVPDLAELTAEHRRFVGFWEFDSVERRTADGEPLPANHWRAGYIIYTPSGHMAVHLARPDRQPYADGGPTPEEANAALGSYASYFGPFTIHADEGYVVHHRIGNTSPNGIGTDAQRFYEFAGNQLILKPPPATVDGREVQSFIHWNRLRQRGLGEGQWCCATRMPRPSSGSRAPATSCEPTRPQPGDHVCRPS